MSALGIALRAAKPTTQPLHEKEQNDDDINSNSKQALAECMTAGGIGTTAAAWLLLQQQPATYYSSVFSVTLP